MGKQKKSFKVDRETINDAVAAANGVAERVAASRPDLSGVSGSNDNEPVGPVVPVPVIVPASGVQPADPKPMGFICLKLAAFGVVRREDVYKTRAEAIAAAVRMQGPHMVAPIW